MNKGVGEIGQRIKQNGAKQNLQSAFAISQNPKDDSTDQHSAHLKIEK